MLADGKITLKVGTGEVVSARSVGNLKFFFGDSFIILDNVLFVLEMKKNLILISCLLEQLYKVSFEINEVFIFKKGIHICSAKLENNLYMLKSRETKAILNTEMFTTAETQNKRQKISPNTYLWHLRLGYINLNRIGRLVKRGLLNELEDNSFPPCESCLEVKMTKRHFFENGYGAKETLELVHTNLCDPMNVKAQGRYEYFISFIDDYSRYDNLYLMHHKSEALEKFREYKTEVENLLRKTIKTLQSDRGGEYMDLIFQDYMIEYGITSQLSVAGMPQ